MDENDRISFVVKHTTKTSGGRFLVSILTYQNDHLSILHLLLMLNCYNISIRRSEHEGRYFVY